MNRVELHPGADLLTAVKHFTVKMDALLHVPAIAIEL